jgi:hypothetical protein
MSRKFIITESDRIHIKSLYEQTELTPETPALEPLNQILSDANLPTITPDEIEELSPDCPVEFPQNQYQNLLYKIQTLINNTNDINTLKNELKKVSSSKEQGIQEQVASGLVILGVTIPPVAIAIVAGLITLMLIIKLAKLIFGKKTHKTSSSCKRRSKLFRKFGVDGMFM